MNTSFLTSSLAAVAMIAITGCSSPADPPSADTGELLPVIMGLTPTSGTAGTIMIVDGLHLGTSPATTKLYFPRGVLAHIDSMTEKRIFTRVPVGAQTGTVAATVNELGTPGTTFAHFTMLEAPAVQGMDYWTAMVEIGGITAIEYQSGDGGDSQKPSVDYDINRTVELGETIISSDVNLLDIPSTRATDTGTLHSRITARVDPLRMVLSSLTFAYQESATRNGGEKTDVSYELGVADLPYTLDADGTIHAELNGAMLAGHGVSLQRHETDQSLQGTRMKDLGPLDPFTSTSRVAVTFLRR